MSMKALCGNSGTFIVQKEAATEKALSIKGFASVNNMDRSRDIVEPVEFNLEALRKSPTLLFNHKFWKTDDGNETAIGRVTFVTPAVIRRAMEGMDSSVPAGDFLIYDLFSEEYLGSYPSDAAVGLMDGDHGLFVKADVYEPEVIKMIQNGEVGAFSWRGISTRVEAEDEIGQPVTYWQNIDLYEISVVHIPDNPSATFVVGKNFGGIGIDGSSLVGIRFPKEKFNSETVLKFLSANKFTRNIQEHTQEFVSVQKNFSQTGEIIDVPFGDAVLEIVHPQRVEEDSVAEKKFQSEKPDNSETLGGSTMSEEKKAPEAPAQTAEKSVQETPEQKAPVITDEVMKSLSEAIATSVSEKVTEKMTPAFESVSKSLESIGGNFGTFAEKMESVAKSLESVTAAPEKAPEAPAMEETEKKKSEEMKASDKEEYDEEKTDAKKNFDILAEALLAQKEAIEDIQKSLQSYGESVPSGGHRAERVDTQKKRGETPEDVLGSIFPSFIQ